MFGHVSMDPDVPGLFDVFYDITSEEVSIVMICTQDFCLKPCTKLQNLIPLQIERFCRPQFHCGLSGANFL